jgi:hypothetical protein
MTRIARTIGMTKARWSQLITLGSHPAEASTCRELRASTILLVGVDFIGVVFVVAAESQPQHVE